MLKIRNLRRQIIILEKLVDGKQESFRIPSRGEVTISEEQLTQDIVIKNERGDVKLTKI